MKSTKEIIYELVASNKLDPKDATRIFLRLQNNDKNDPTQDEIAVIGMAGRFPQANNINEYWDNLTKGVNCIGNFPEQRRKDVDKLFSDSGTVNYSKGGYMDEVDKFDASFFHLSPKEAKWIDPIQRMFLEVAWESIEDAGYCSTSIYGTKTGVYVGNDHAEGQKYRGFIQESDPMVMTGTYSGILSSRISYFLNLQGPSIVVDTACSSALVALHLACQALKHGECDMAIAGGVSLKLIPVADNSLKVVESDNSMVKPFDKNANGTVWGEGVGCLLLKTLKKAIADRDIIHAVIKGSAINNDGASNGITAPSAEAQERVIVAAWENARVNPETVSYIEAHGTGTVLGDPIEIKGLTKAFRRYTQKKQFCGIGSVKSNIGHLVAASGMASMIKVILAMKNKVIPASINFNQPNSFIDFNSSPVYVVDKLKEWELKGHQRRAGVSSFGFSGTNVHIVLEEYTNTSAINVNKPENKNKEIFLISAKNTQTLKILISKYKEIIDNNSQDELSDICYSVNICRDHYNCRLAVIARSKEDLTEKLAKTSAVELGQLMEKDMYYGEYKIVGENVKEKSTSEITEGDKKQLSAEASLKIEQFLTSAQDIDIVIREICQLYIKGAHIDWKNFYKGKNRRKVNLPPYPLERVRYWAESGNIKKVILDEKLSNSHPLLGKCLVDSIHEEIYSQEFSVEKHWVLREHKVGGKSIVPGTVYIEMVREACKKCCENSPIEIKDMTLLAPLLVNEQEVREVHTIISKKNDCMEFTIASRLKSDDKNRDVGWIKHTEGKVCKTDILVTPYIINDVVQKCGQENKDITFKDKLGVFEFGSRWNNVKGMYTTDNTSLVELELQEKFLDELNQYKLHPSMLDKALNAMMQDVTEGVYLPFHYRSLKVYKAMPTKFYSYIRKKIGKTNAETISFDISLLDDTGGIFVDIEDYTIKRVHEKDLKNRELAGKKDMFFETVWIPMGLEYKNTDAYHRSILVVYDESAYGNKIIEQLKVSNKEVIEVCLGEKYEKVNDNKYEIKNSQDNFNHLLEKIKNKDIHKIVYISTPEKTSEVNGIYGYPMNCGIHCLLYLTKAIFTSKINKKFDVVFISNNVNAVTGEEENINPIDAALFGFGKVVGQEFNNLRCRCIDTDDETPIENIINEIEAEYQTYLVAYRKGNRYVEEFLRLDIKASNLHKVQNSGEGVYIITGGTGGIGLEITKYLASKSKVSLALINRSSMPERREWEKIILEGQNKRLCEKLKKLIEIEKTGSDAICYSADISNIDEIRNILDQIRCKFGRIKGIFHCAGLAGDGLILNEDEESINRVLAPKIQGTWILHKLTEKENLDFFVVFSSIASLIGGVGEGDYTAANSYLDSFAAYRNRLGKRTIAINWSAWEEAGMAVDYGTAHKGTIFKSLTKVDALECLELILNSNRTNVIVGEINYEILNNIGNGELLRISDKIKSRATSKANTLNRNPGKKESHNSFDVIISGRQNNNYSLYEKQLAKIWGEIFELETIDIYQKFHEIGGDSILATQLVQKINDEYPEVIKISDVFLYPSISEMADYIKEEINIKNDIQISKNEDESSIEKNDCALEEEKTASDDTSSIAAKQVIIANTSGRIVLDGIEPFNDIYYKSCFYNSTFPVARFFGKDILSMLVNETIVYSCDETKDGIGLNIKYIPSQSTEDILMEMGISVETKRSSESIIDDIIASLSKSRPVVIWIDCFYESIRNEMYLKTHWPHTLLIYGYDAYAKTFDIIEHMHRDNLLYTKRNISFDDIIKCYTGFRENFGGTFNTYDYYEFYIDKTKSLENSSHSNKKGNSILAFACNMIDKKKVVLVGLQCLEKFCEDSRHLVMNKEELDKNSDNLLKLLNDVINSKTVEKYKLGKLYGVESHFYEMASDIVTRWSSLRVIIAKYIYLLLYNSNKHINMATAAETIKGIYYAELEYYKILFEHLENYIQAKRE